MQVVSALFVATAACFAAYSSSCVVRETEVATGLVGGLLFAAHPIHVEAVRPL